MVGNVERSFDEHGTDLTVKYATETRSPEDMRRFGEAAFFLKVFGQANRDYSERNNQGAIDQAIMLMNSSFVTERLEAKPGSSLAELMARQPPLGVLALRKMPARCGSAP